MDKTSRRLALALIAVLALTFGAAALAGCGGDEATDSADAAAAAPFKIGVAGPMTGQYATYGASHKAGAELAMEELNAAGGVNGGEVSIALGDDLGDPKEAVLVAQKFIDDSDIVVVDGHQFSGATIAAGGKYQPAGLPMITPSATQPDITDLGDFIWRICMTDAVQGKGLADYSVGTLGLQNIAIMYDNSDYGRGLADAYDEGVKAAGGTSWARSSTRPATPTSRPSSPRSRAPTRTCCSSRATTPRAPRSRPAGQRARHGRAAARLRRLRLGRAAEARRRRRRGHARVHLLRLHEGRPGRADVRRRVQGQV